ncbi:MULTISPECIES: type II secretion system F family protein [Pseudovibrio]|uniref:type II secretion system F family protein n=1 Tax=Stappiaceae TaxID=2821832 RepID=UPI00236646C2|nr:MULTISPECIES: type II secretion system F family protein [Pseudovibrio]MDD7910094.1 type II secretion system F family protein [Pseudovibrio exalbescens]MDX5592377.1 type II secretion system F family protein [Pseudovibrio sp. SPO723]
MSLHSLLNQETLIALCVAVAVAGTIITIALPLLERDHLKSRMKTVALERENIRAKERARLAAEKEAQRANIRNKPKQNVKDFVDKYNLRELLSNEQTSAKLKMAGFRGTGPLYTFLFMRIVMPIVLALASLLYTLVLLGGSLSSMMGLGISAAIGAIGFYAPNIYVQNKISKRQTSIRKAWPDALDLMLICVESGMSIEAAFKRVSEEIGIQSIELSEELALANAELSFLQDRSVAYNNLAERTGLDGVKNVVLALNQAEKYGTSLGFALRVMADENRLQRMQAAEKKAASLPPKLTVPMIVFFLPVLFFVIMGPAVIQVLDTF